MLCTTELLLFYSSVGQLSDAAAEAARFGYTVVDRPEGFLVLAIASLGDEVTELTSPPELVDMEECKPNRFQGGQMFNVCMVGKKVLNPEIIKGPWTKEEDGYIMKLVEANGCIKWSPAVVMAFLMKSRRWTLDQSYQWVKERKSRFL
ncbi:poly [ADP-ribose] polymerase 3 [Tanacetum coccineum]